MPEPRVVFLVNVIAPYQKPVFDRLARHFAHMRILLSTPMESNRSWKIDWHGLDTAVQKTITINRSWRHPQGFREALYIHLPIDTVSQLRRYRANVVVSWEMGVRTMLAALYRWVYRSSKLLVWAEFSESVDHGRGRLRFLLRKILHHAVDGFLVTGESGARYLRSLGVPERKIHKIAYTTEVSYFARAEPQPSDNGCRRLLYVGQLIERKGLLPFLATLARWGEQNPDRKVEFRLAGDGPLRRALQNILCPPMSRSLSPARSATKTSRKSTRAPIRLSSQRSPIPGEWW